MRSVVVTLALGLALCLVPSASAKFKLTLALGDSTPAVRQPFTVVLLADVKLAHELRLIAVAPGRGWYDVVGTVTGASGTAHATIPRDGFEIRLTRVTPSRWRGILRLPRAGRWLLVVPNWAPVGFAIPPPLTKTVAVG